MTTEAEKVQAVRTAQERWRAAADRFDADDTAENFEEYYRLKCLFSDALDAYAEGCS